MSQRRAEEKEQMRLRTEEETDADVAVVGTRTTQGKATRSQIVRLTVIAEPSCNDAFFWQVV